MLTRPRFEVKAIRNPRYGNLTFSAQHFLGSINCVKMEWNFSPDDEGYGLDGGDTEITAIVGVLLSSLNHVHNHEGNHSVGSDLALAGLRARLQVLLSRNEERLPLQDLLSFASLFVNPNIDEIILEAADARTEKGVNVPLIMLMGMMIPQFGTQSANITRGAEVILRPETGGVVYIGNYGSGARVSIEDAHIPRLTGALLKALKDQHARTYPVFPLQLHQV